MVRRLIRSMSGDDGGAGNRGEGGGLIRSGSKRFMKTLSTANVMVGVLEEGVKAGASLGMELGTGAAAGVAGAAGAVGSLTSFSSQKRNKGSSARRRLSELNIFGDGEIMTVEHTLKNIQQTKENVHVTKLELEDVINREDGKEAQVFGAVKDMLLNDGGRQWKYVSFIDTIRVGFMGEDVSRLKSYEKELQTLWAGIQQEANGKPLRFQVKLEILEDTTVTTIIDLFTELQRMHIVKIEYMGGLYGYKPPEIADALYELCKPEDEFSSVEKCGVLNDMILLTVHLTACEESTDQTEAPTTTTKDATTSHKDKSKVKIWKKVLRKSVNRLKGKTTSCSGDSESDLSAMRAAAVRARPSSAYRNTRTSRSLSPPRKTSMARSDHEAKSSALDLSGHGGTSHNRRRKPRRIGTPPASPTRGEQQESGGGSPKGDERTKRSSRSVSPKTRHSHDPNLVKKAAMAAESVSSPRRKTDPLGGFDSSHHRRRMNIHIVALPLDDDSEDDEMANDNNSNGSFEEEEKMPPPPPPPGRLKRAISSPMERPSGLVSSRGGGLKRSHSMNRKRRPKGHEEKKKATPIPDYDWSTHVCSHGPEAECGECTAAKSA